MEEGKMVELHEAVVKGISNAEDSIGQLGDILLNCANRLRSEQSEEVFTALSTGIDNLSRLIALIKELKNGLTILNTSVEHLSVWDKSVGLFQAMVSAFERSDWITLSDLIQHELHPMLMEAREGLSTLKETL